jgi:saccharopine dehydrogenase (NADP+, L-glutamate forming)
MKSILILGSGFVSRPGIVYLIKQNKFYITIASNELKKPEDLVKNHSNAKVVYLNVEDKKDLSELISYNDIIVSLLPYKYHPAIAEICLEQGKHLITTSYVSDKIKQFDEAAKQKGLIFLNETGLDPGIDHMSAMRIIDQVHSSGGKVLEYYSYCGGLPAPDNNDNPFGYKFSWSPRGVVMASINSARYLENGKIVNINGRNLFSHYEIEDLDDLGSYEVYPNRDSLIYKNLYGLKDAVTVKRGTYRNLGWCNIFKCLVNLGLIDESIIQTHVNLTYRNIIEELIGSKRKNIKKIIASKNNISEDSDVINALEWLGLFSDEKVVSNNRLDMLCDLLQKKLYYSEGERDMIILKHKFLIQNEDKIKELLTSTLIEFGTPHGDSAMAKTVSLPMAISTRLIAEEKIKSTGVIIPLSKEIYEPVLNELEYLDITMFENRLRL